MKRSIRHLQQGLLFLFVSTLCGTTYGDGDPLENAESDSAIFSQKIAEYRSQIRNFSCPGNPDEVERVKAKIPQVEAQVESYIEHNQQGAERQNVFAPMFGGSSRTDFARLVAAQKGELALLRELNNVLDEYLAKTTACGGH